MAIGGSLFVGVDSNRQEPVKKENNFVTLEISESGDFIIPGFFTVFVDGDEAFRMVVGDTINVERACRIVAFNGFESKPSHVWYLTAGDTLTVGD